MLNINFASHNFVKGIEIERSGGGGVFSWISTRQNLVHPPKPPSEFGAPPPPHSWSA